MDTSGKRRLFVLLMLLTAAIAALLVRLGSLQLLSSIGVRAAGADLVAQSVHQRERGLLLDSGRGQIVDRSLQPFTGGAIRALAYFPVKPGSGALQERWKELWRLLHTTEREWNRFTAGGGSQPRLWSGADAPRQPLELSAAEAERVRSLALPGVEVLHVEQRYREPAPAGQVLGYVSEDPERVRTEFADQISKGLLREDSLVGASGLEKQFEHYLQGAGPTTVSLFTDGAKEPLPGLKVRLFQPGNPYYPTSLVTTLDRRLQVEVERLMDKAGIRSGAVVVLDASSSDIVAMASSPSFNPNQVDPQSGKWRNQALRAVAPGSVFKLVVAAAALEEKAVRPDEAFTCQGELGRYGFSCWLRGGHGKLTMAEAFAQSCNLVFAQVMQRLDAGRLERYALRLGLAGLSGWSGDSLFGGETLRQLDGEDKGQIFSSQADRTDSGLLIQTAIGQRDVLVSPLQAAQMINIILQGDQARAPRIVSEVRYANGMTMDRFPAQQAHRPAEGLSPQTVKTLKAWMRDVVVSGTGMALRNAKWPLAGKSGTAQTGAGAVHQWFAGYGPSDKPAYTVAVVVHDQPENGVNRALPLFKEVMDLLASADGRQ
ncbi:peptidoglycan D,D-transpeptidase FtsI family protein [Paenibacillus sp. y28]|uniref:peptidoglycan D,D-transpeptidase FtsI family protein n=1 Tax=Paenibacillus sp. y28 TaxID=3129110 RepID=UPI0030176786